MRAWSFKWKWSNVCAQEEMTLGWIYAHSGSRTASGLCIPTLEGYWDKSDCLYSNHLFGIFLVLSEYLCDACIYLSPKKVVIHGRILLQPHAAFCLHPDTSSSHTYAGAAGLKSLSKHFLTPYKTQMEAMS